MIDLALSALVPFNFSTFNKEMVNLLLFTDSKMSFTIKFNDPYFKNISNRQDFVNQLVINYLVYPQLHLMYHRLY